MSESEIYADPQRILTLADELSSFTANIQTEVIRMDEELRSLGATWQDEEYKKFKRTFDRLKEGLSDVAEEIKKRQPELQEDAQILKTYLDKST